MGNELEKVDKIHSPNPIKTLLAMEMAGETIVSKRCLICRSESRKDMEKMYDDGGSLVAIKAFLDEHDPESKASTNAIKHHMEKHHNNMERLAFILEYCDRYDELVERRNSREAHLQSLIDTATVELSRIIMIPTKNDIQREKTRNEMILKTISSIRESISSRNDMEEGDTALKALQLSFAKTWQACIDDAPPDKKPIFIAALKEFKKKFDER